MIRCVLCLCLVLPAAAGDVAVTVRPRTGPTIVGTLVDFTGIEVKTRYGVLRVPASDLLRLDAHALRTQGGVLVGKRNLTRVHVRTTYGEATMPLSDIARIDWNRPRRPVDAAALVQLADGSRVRGRLSPARFRVRTRYGVLEVPLAQVKQMHRQETDIVIQLPRMSCRGVFEHKEWKIETRYGVLTVPVADLWRAMPRGMPMEGDRLAGGFDVRAVDFSGGHTYAVVSHDDGIGWQQALDVARRLGGHLATVGDAEENALLTRLAERLGRKGSFWIGYTDADQEGAWRWVTGENSRYSNWYTGEPNNAGGENYCELNVGWGGRWNDVGDARKTGCLIELDGD